MNDCLIFEKTITIDGSLVTCREELFEALRPQLGENVLMGSNLDALHDVLTAIACPTEIIIAGRSLLEESLGSYWNHFYTMLMDCLDENSLLSLSFE